MTNLTPQQQKARRRRRLHERQAVVYGSLLAVLAIAALGGAAVYSDSLDLGFLDRDFVTPEPEPTAPRPPVPCLAEGVPPVPYAEVRVAVLNGSGRTGLAAETANAVSTRGFVVSETGNNPERIDWSAAIGFGAAGIARAYTLAAHLNDPVLVLDTREGTDIDLVLGEAFTGLVDPATVLLDPTVPLVSAPDCVPLTEALEDAPEPRERPEPTTAPETDDTQDGGEDFDDGTGEGEGDEGTGEGEGAEEESAEG